MGTYPGFGELLRRYRAAAGLSQEELAERAGLSARGIADLERGARSAPHPQTVRKLVAALQLADDDRALLLAAAARRRGQSAGPGAVGVVELHHQRAIPLPLSRLVGRERECAAIHARLVDRPLVTLAGIGGVGKTRLALAVAAQVDPAHFPDGVYVVELAALTESGQVVRAVASTIGIPEQPGTDSTQIVVQVLRTRRLLLVLDNCEHLIKACAEFTDLLVRSCHQVRVLATSREVLGIPGELAWWVPPLALPDASLDITAASLASIASVHLFTERAAASQPGFALNNANAAVVAELCRELDGLPLAIELAAARLKVLSIDELAARLADRFRLLVGGSRTAPSRQQTLRAALDWSYDLLREPEQQLFERLSVFAGGWALETAESICPDQVLSTADVLPLLEHLVDQSLVVVEPAADALATRYGMLETVRLYARERLAARGQTEVALIEERHAAAFLTLAERAEVELFGFQQDYWFAQLESERDNLRAALRWAVESGRAAIAVPLAAALSSFWIVGAQFAEGRAWSERVLAMPSSHEVPKFRARLAVGASTFGLATGDVRTIEATLGDVADLDNQLADAPHFEARLLYTRAAVAQRRGDWAVAREVLERLESHAFVAAFPGFRAMCVQLLAETCLGAGDLDGAYRHASRALGLADEVGFASASGLALYTLGTVEYRAGDLASARQHFEASARGGQERSHGPRWWAIYALSSLSHVAIDQGQYASGRAALLESVARWPELGNAAALARLLEASAHLAVATGRHVEALRLVGTAGRLRESAGRPTSAAERVALEKRLRPAYDSLSEEIASAAWQAGQAILPDEALRVASASLADGDVATVPAATSLPRRRG